jgi:SAM-dependent methyltransferase
VESGKVEAQGRERMSFDAIAPHYRWLEQVTAGSLLQCCRTQFLHELGNARNILLLGEGHGRFLIELVKINPTAQITCLDASARMLERAHAALEKYGPLDRIRCSSSAVIVEEEKPRERGVRTTNLPANPVRFVHSDIIKDNRKHPSDRYDAVASHFFLDCFPPDQLQQVCRVIAQWSVPRAVWLISDFCVPEHGWRRARARCILWMLYRFFRMTTGLPATRLTPPEKQMEAAGFQLRNRKHFNHSLLHSDVWEKT